MDTPSFLVALLLLCSVAMTQAVSFECGQQQLQEAQKRCFSGIDLDFAGIDENVQSVIQRNPTAVCSFPEKYKNAMQCALNLAFSCLRSMGQRTDILPSAETIVRGITFLCNNIDNVDINCLQRSQDRLKSCVMDKVVVAFRQNSNYDITFITCKTFNLTAECLGEVLASCPLKTMSVFVKYTVDFVFPPACRSGNVVVDDRDETGNRFTTMVPMTTAQLVTVVPVLPYVQCYSETSIQAGQLQCFRREDINIQLPQARSSQAKQSYIDAIFANNRDINTLCQAGQLERYKRALVCAMDIPRKCMPATYEDYLPASSKMSAMLEELCESRDEVDQTCVANQASNLFDCGFRKAQELRSTDVKSVLCSAFRLNVVCQKEVLPACGCQTTSTYVKMSKMYLNPPACPNINEPSPICDSVTGKFISGGVDKIRASFFTLLLSAGWFLLFVFKE